ncbi:hypothetical protein [Gordonia terrae]|uniref:hypothetical protein n=1 Tax=Gordonia terrae TaxID=2055 RepID=UPI003F6AFA25
MSSPEQFYNTHGAGNERTFDGARTEWAGMGIDEILDVLASMNPGVADGDVNTILQAIEAIRRAAESMHGMFGDQMSGQASDAALEAGRSLSADMATTSASAGRIGDAMSGAAGILESTRGQEGRLRELQQHLRDNPEDAASVRHEVDRTMTGTYSSPMIGVQYTLPREPVNANGMTSGAGTVEAIDTTGSAAGGGGSETTRGQAANTVDAGDFGPSGARAAPTPVPAAGPGPAGGGPGTTASPAAASGPSTGSAPRVGADGPDGLLRGGRGTPEAVMRGASSTRDSQNPTGHAGGSVSGAAAGASGGSGSVAPLAMPAPAPAPAPGPSSAAPLSTPVSSPASASTPPGAVGQRPGGIGSPGPLGAPPGTRRPGGDDETHRAAPYLNTREHGAEIVGDMPLVGPPVIGDWVRQAFPSTPEPAPAPAPEHADASPSGNADGDRPASTRTTDAEVPAPAKPGGA